MTVVCVLTGDAKVAKAQTPAVFEDHHLFASDGQGGVFPDLGDQFGLSVAVTGSSGSEVAIVGARSDDTPGGTSAGSAYIYRFNGTNWVEEAHLFAFDGAANDQYGQSVSIGGAPGAEVAIVGAWVDNTVAGIDAGSVYIYRFNGTIWLFEEQLVASDGAANDFFGTSVSISGTSGNEVAIVGAVLDDTAGGNNAGSAYIYRFNGTSWVEETHIFASDGQGNVISGDQFGDTVSINSNGGSEIAIVGAFLDNTSAGTDAGSAYVFRFNGTNWVEEGHLFASDAFEADRFGDAVSITGAPGNEVAIIGAPFDLAMGIV
ncbi:MAG: hypothetical protein IIB54_04515, partial [Planctomycetes bacterium]|nr:hypothetical protein [Planctomycetota bacterium]